MFGHFVQEIKNFIFASLHFYDNSIGECYWQKIYYCDLPFVVDFLRIDNK